MKFTPHLVFFFIFIWAYFYNQFFFSFRTNWIFYINNFTLIGIWDYLRSSSFQFQETKGISVNSVIMYSNSVHSKKHHLTPKNTNKKNLWSLNTFILDMNHKMIMCPRIKLYCNKAFFNFNIDPKSSFGLIWLLNIYW